MRQKEDMNFLRMKKMKLEKKWKQDCKYKRLKKRT